MIMGFWRFWYDLRNFCETQWVLNRKFFWWCFVFVLAGIVIGMTYLTNPLMIPQRVGQSVIDRNLDAITRFNINPGFGRLVMGRMMDFALAGLLVFIFGLSKYSALLVFPLITLRTVSIVMNLYWVVARVGMASGIALFVAYLVFFLALLFVFIMLSIFLMKQCALIRHCSMKHAINWWEFWKVIGCYAFIVFLIALVEWLVFAVVFSKMIFLV
jgi:hypothetical protein